MTKRGKSITMFLMDGEANGRIKAYISNWIGLGYKIPRDRLADCNDVYELSQSSVYLLFGQATTGKSPVYIGQAGVRKNGKGILARLIEHNTNPDKDYWTEAVVFTTSNNSFGPTELSFLENRFCNMAIQAARYEVKNAVDPTPGNITEEKESELDEFADYAKLILGVLGYKVFEPLRENEVVHIYSSQIVPKVEKPGLPSRDLKIGEYVRLAMRNLSNCGYTFSDIAVDEMCTSEWSVKNFSTQKPFMRRVTGNDYSNRDTAGNVRFWSEVFTFGTQKVLISKEWYEKHFDLFDVWYESLFKG